ncbi:MAG: 6-phosphogluconolactonase [Xanthobacteraceae bacterium]|nr:6-phosphogluconolactonase [Xanthobacteraceae bacterium]
MKGALPKTIVVADAATLAVAAAERLLARIARDDRQVAICLTGGSTPKRLYELLATSAWRERIPWTRVQWFMGDDRFVPQDDKLSNIGMARRAFLDECAPPSNVHPIPTQLPSPDEAATVYEKELRAFAAKHRAANEPLFDLVLLGVGPDGHTASLFPGYPAASETRRWVVGVPKAHVEPFVPRVSLTQPCLAMCEEMLLLASGHDKKEILARAFAHDDLPAAHARSAKGETIWMIDEAAAPPGIDGA